jgi:prepilin signal peptidase PulO-like enzyme (type II secretory pathway)
MCLGCEHQIPWRENIPVVSFICLKGRCSRCRFPIPSWLPLIEIAGAAAGIWVVEIATTITVINVISIIKIISAIAIASALVWIFFSDLVYGIISDWAVVLGSMGAIVWQISRMSPIWLILAAAIAAAVFFWLLAAITRGRGMGTGDITLSFFLGLLLGWPLILVGVWLAFVIGAIYGVGLIVLRKKKFGQTIPFGPFLIVGAIISSGLGQFLLDKWL